MSFDFPKYSPAERIVHTSVYDGCISIQHETDVSVLKEALELEKRGSVRSSLIKAIRSRIRKLERGR